MIKLFIDPTIQVRGKPPVCRFVTVPRDTEAGLKSAARMQYSSLLKAVGGKDTPQGKALRVNASNFKDISEKVPCLVWELKGESVCLVLPNDNPKAIDAARRFIDSKFIPKNYWDQVQHGVDFSIGKPGVGNALQLRAYLKGLLLPPSYPDMIKVPCAYLDPTLPDESYSYSRPVPFTFFLCGKKLRVDGEKGYRISPYCPNEAFFLNDWHTWSY